jgi:hypothetical protein
MQRILCNGRRREEETKASWAEGLSCTFVKAGRKLADGSHHSAFCTKERKGQAKPKQAWKIHWKRGPQTRQSGRALLSSSHDGLSLAANIGVLGSRTRSFISLAVKSVVEIDYVQLGTVDLQGDGTNQTWSLRLFRLPAQTVQMTMSRRRQTTYRYSRIRIEQPGAGLVLGSCSDPISHHFP